MQTVPTVEELNERHGTRFRSAGPYAGGEVGAERLLDPAGNRYVLKRQAPGRAPQTTDVLRAVGYPAPLYVFVGDSYSVQHELPGEPLGGWDVPMPTRLLHANELQAGRAIDADRSWPAVVVSCCPWSRASRNTW